MKRRAVLAALVTAAGAVAAAQTTGASRFALATVADPRGRALVDLAADDFAVQEGGAGREILSVRPADYPIALIVATGGRSDDREDVQAAARHFVERLGAERAVALVGGDPPRQLAALTDERRAIFDGLAPDKADASMTADPIGAVSLAARTLHETGTLFSAIVVIADVIPDLDRVAVDAALGGIVTSGPMVHVVERAGGAGGAGTAGGAGQGRLRDIAEQTRGEYARIYTAASYQAALDRLADRLVSELLIEYLVPVGSKPYDVKIGVKLPGARVRGLGVEPR